MKHPIADLKNIRRLFPKREQWKFVVLFGLMTVAAVLEAIGVGAIPIFVAFVMDPSTLSDQAVFSRWFPDFGREPTPDLVLWASAILFGFVLLKNGFLMGFSYVQARVGSMQRARLADRVFRAYQGAPYDWLVQRSTSELQRTIVEVTTRILNGVVMPYLDLCLTLILSLAIVVAMALVTPGATLVSIAIVGAGIFMIVRVMRKTLRKAGQAMNVEFERSLTAIQQGIGALVDARIARCESALAKIHRDTAVRLSRAHIIGAAATRATPAAIETLATLGLLALLLVILNSGDTLTSALPIFSVIGVAMIRLKQVASRGAQAVHLINQFSDYVPTLLKDLDELNALDRKRRKNASNRRLIDDFQILELQAVNYTYPKSDSVAVDGISLIVRKGESIAFVGPTGCGKSTLANLILGLLEPQSGSIKVNGVDIYRDLDGWRTCLGYVPQSIFLIDDTIRANIAFGVAEKDIDPDRIRTSLESAALAEFVASLPDGLETMIGERGVRLSGGQRQRLGIARALYLDPQVLVMDEATSALDNRTEVEVMEAIQNVKRERTLIMIAHRLTTVEGCDRLYLLASGKIHESGRHSELMECSHRFRRMAAS